MSAGVLRQYDGGIEYDLPSLPVDGGVRVAEVAATEEGVYVNSPAVMLTADEARLLADYLHDAAAWVEAVTA